MQPPTPLLRIFIFIVALIGWSAIVLQCWLSLQLSMANGRGIGMGLVIFFGYFTVLTNILAALALTAPYVAPQSGIGKFFARPGVNTAIAAYIAVVGITYSLLLRHIWDPQGLQKIVDVALHDAMPVLFIFYWWFAAPKQGLQWRHVFVWSIYPVGYLLYSLAHGALTGLYPYPFIDISQLGYARVMVNAACMLIAFWVIALIFIGIGRMRQSHRG